MRCTKARAWRTPPNKEEEKKKQGRRKKGKKEMMKGREKKWCVWN
jgi:hypothetical protein